MVSKKGTTRTLEQEVEENYQEFLKMTFHKEDSGKWALLRRGKVADTLEAKTDADKLGSALYKDGLYSLQQIDSKKIDMGYATYCLA